MVSNDEGEHSKLQGRLIPRWSNSAVAGIRLHCLVVAVAKLLLHLLVLQGKMGSLSM